MLAHNLISDIIPSLRTSDTGQDALNWMETFRVSHIPIVNNSEFLGLIADEDIYDLNIANEPLGNHSLSLIKPYVMDYQHIYDVIEVLSRLKLTLVPVLDVDKKYLGVITLSDLMQHFSELLAVHNDGGLIQIEVESRDYALSEIARIVEDENAKVLSLYLSQNDINNNFIITLKLNTSDLSAIVSAFERYDYRIKTSYYGSTETDEKAKENYESLLRYLNV